MKKEDPPALRELFQRSKLNLEEPSEQLGRKSKCGNLFTIIIYKWNIFHRSGKKDKDSRKRERTASMAKLDKFDVPAAKMARAMGNDPRGESKFLEESFKKKERR